MAQQHIVKAFDDQLNALDAKIAEMGGLAESMLADAVDALSKRDAELAAEVVAGDRKLDQLEEEVNTLAMRLLALRQPTAGDLRAVIAALKISSDLERAGDLAKNVAKRTITIAKAPPVTPVTGIVNLGALVQGRIHTAIDAFVARDAKLAMDVWSCDEEVDQLHTSLFRELLTYMMEDPRNITPCAHLLFVAKNIERIGDHITNVAERIVFLVRGKLPERERHKEDESPYTEVRPFKKEG
ncbi:MAG: phosphate signaling complex protein PhoU [Alphaproteobacteria bacterium]|nr:phosphate signaling complex protein PhoU [Alphaproteobacteria bacterium]